MANEKLFHIGAKALIINESNKVLLMKEDVSNHSLPTSEYWDLPGGRMQKGENALETLRREVEEETGIKEIKSQNFVTAVISNHEIKLKTGEIIGLVLMIYRVEVDSTRPIRLSDEHLTYEWTSIETAAERLTHKYPKEFTQSLNKFLAQ